MNANDARTMNLREFARLLGVSKSTAFRAAADGTLPVPLIRIGRRLVVSRALVERLLAADDVSER